VGRLQGAGVVTAILSNGRRAQIRLVPAPVPASEVNKLRAAFNASERRSASLDAANSRAISRLKRTQASAVSRLTAEQVKSDRELRKSIVDVHSKLDKRIATELSGQKTGLAKLRKRIMRQLKQQRTRALWNNILTVSALPFFAAYGKRSDPFHKNNLILTGSLGGWLVLDDVVDRFMGRGKGKGTSAWTTGANTWSYLAPIGNAATVHFLLKDKLHDRFITGVATGVTTTEKAVPLDIPADSVEEFKKLSPKPIVVATVVGGVGTATAKVGDDGRLLVSVSDLPTGNTGPVNVAFIVDSRPAISAAATT
jgi:hypothetical protein